DIGDYGKNDTGFAFSGLLDHNAPDTIYIIGTTIAHEAGHTFGLEHIDNVKDIMDPYAHANVDGFTTGYVADTKIKRFQDEPVILRKHVGSTLPGDDTPPTTTGGKDNMFCNGIQELQNFLAQKFLGHLNGNEDFLQTPKMCTKQPFDVWI